MLSIFTSPKISRLVKRKKPMVCRHAFNALPNDIISDLSKLKAFADDN